MSKGYLALVLHAHLPYVRHPEDEYFIEENWLYEAITECYIPLINTMENLVNDNVDFRLTMSITPPLMSMLTDSLLQDRYIRHLEKLLELADKEIHRTRWQPEYNNLAYMYRELFQRAYNTFHYYGRNLLSAFKKFQDMGQLEVITCGATHGYLPLIGLQPNSIRAQIAVAVDVYTRHMGKKPRGIWLPECGYFPGNDQILKDFGLRYFFTDTHGIMYASTRPKYSIFAPIYCPSGVAAFGRDMESSKQVWSANEGYPGDYNYREFYRDIGYDLDFDYIYPYIHPEGIRQHTGIKYYKITGPGQHKKPYDAHTAYNKTAEHAGNFMFNRQKQVEYLARYMDRPPIIVSPYDAELFGHWWFEGPHWLNFLMRKIHFDQDTIKLITPSEYLNMYPVNQVTTPCQSSWGYKGYHEVWLEGSNDWIYRHLHKAAERMAELSDTYPQTQGDLRRTLNQAARELLLAQSSDWAFIMKTGTMVDYAVKRTKEHIWNFNKLYDDIKWNRIDTSFLEHLEWQNNIFPDIDYMVYSSRPALVTA